MKAYAQFTSASLALMLLASSVMAAVSPQQADQLGTSLTPLGAQKEGNANGSIPAWTGGLPKNAGQVGANGFLADPFASEKPLLSSLRRTPSSTRTSSAPGSWRCSNASPKVIGYRSTQPIVRRRFRQTS